MLEGGDKFDEDFYKDKPDLKIGSGSDKTVFTDPSNPEKAVGIFHPSVEETPLQARGRFFLSKILHILFPENIPNIHFSGHNPKAIITTKIHHGVPVETSKEEKSDLVKKLKSVGLMVDDVSDNIIRSEDGHIVYTDNQAPWYIYNFPERKTKEKTYDTEKINAAIEQLPTEKREQALTYLSQLEAAYEEEDGINPNKED